MISRMTINGPPTTPKRNVKPSAQMKKRDRHPDDSGVLIVHPVREKPRYILINSEPPIVMPKMKPISLCNQPSMRKK